MQLVLLLLWIKAAQGLYLGRKKSESMNEDDVSILHTYNAVAYIKSEEDDLPVLPFHLEEKDSKPTKQKNLKKMISKGKLGATKAGQPSSYDLEDLEMMGSSDSTFGAKFVPVTPVDGYEAEAEEDSETEDMSAMEDSEEEGSEDEAEEDSENEVAEGTEDEEGSEDEGSEGESEDSDSSDSSDSSSDSDSSSSDSDSSSSDSDSSSSDSSSSSSSSSSDSEDEEKVPDYYNGESDYVYTYEWDDTDKQVTGSDYEYSYEWAYKEENHEEH